MSSDHTISRKRYLTFERRPPDLSGARRIARRFWSLVALPFELVRARGLGTPGLKYRTRSVALGLRALCSFDIRRALVLIADPMDSFRYFEIEFAADAAARDPVERYLDVSSPRLVPLLVLDQHPKLVGDLVNPLALDLNDTSAYARALRLADRCRFSGALIEHAEYAPESFDLITSISVVEHIPTDAAAVSSMWRLLRPGGRLVITVPCATEACEEYSNLDEYALLKQDGAGYVYWQRYYDEEALAARFWSVTGRPTRMRIWGERLPGAYDANVAAKRMDPSYPYWHEPTMFGREFCEYSSLADLPGMGVIAMEFVKPTVALED